MLKLARNELQLPPDQFDSISRAWISWIASETACSSSRAPLRRFGRPEEVAAVAVMLASDQTAYVTGAEFNIDGGLLAGSAASPTGGRD